MLALRFLLGICLRSPWNPPFPLHALALIPLTLTKVRLSPTLTLSPLMIWYSGLTALFLFLLARAALAFLPTVLSVALRPLFPLQQAQYVPVFPLKSTPFCTGYCIAIAKTLFWNRQGCVHRQLFYKYNFAILLPQKNLMLLGTTRKHRREVLGSLYGKMKIYSCKFLFNHVNGICLFAYQAKKNKYPVMLFSSCHADDLIAISETKIKPVMILEYNKRKRRVDMFDKNLEEFSSPRIWPLLFFTILLML